MTTDTSENCEDRAVAVRESGENTTADNGEPGGETRTGVKVLGGDRGGEG